MKNEIWVCDSCGEEIHDVVFTLTCYAEDVLKSSCIGMSKEAASQNMNQNLSKSVEKHLCKKCKDIITDGVFVV